GPDSEGLAAKRSIRDGPGAQATHAPRDFLRRPRPVDASVLLLEPRRERGESVVLRERLDLAALEPRERFDHEIGANGAQSLRERLRGVLFADLDFPLEQDAARIEPRVDFHGRHASDALATDERPGDRSSAAIL